jgi:micrococcal nuclease
MAVHEYKAEVLEVIDGDTIVLRVDLGYHITYTDKFRLWGINTPETTYRRSGMTDTQWAAEKAAGIQAKDFLTSRLSGKTIWIKSRKQEKFGRWLAIVWTDLAFFHDVEMSINAELLRMGLAAPYKDDPLILTK